MGNKRLLFVADAFLGGGVEIVILRLAKQMIFFGFEVHILFIRNSDFKYEIPKGVIVHYYFGGHESFINRAFINPFEYIRFKRFYLNLEIEFGKFDACISNQPYSSSILIKAGVRNIFFVIHSSVELQLKNTISKKNLPSLLRFVRLRYWFSLLNEKKIICVSQGIKEEILNKKRIKPSEIYAIYNAFDKEYIISRSQEINVGVPKEDYFIWVGRFSKEKNPELFLQAFSLMKNKKILAVMLCENKAAAAKVACDLGVNDRVILPDFQQNPFPWIVSSKALVLSSDFEGLPTVLIEALICGTPIISTRCMCKDDEILSGSLSRFLVPTNNSAELSRAMEKIIVNPPLKNELHAAPILHDISSVEVAREYIRVIYGVENDNNINCTE
ncbi:glycosyltransferase [Shewanella oncorhynchi]|uniref:glycosyltransferase n=1 Tax=Shewanella oncorhynchi TaxID=2726434 RepID=UPI003D7B771D